MPHTLKFTYTRKYNRKILLKREKKKKKLKNYDARDKARRHTCDITSRTRLLDRDGNDDCGNLLFVCATISISVSVCVSVFVQ